MYSFKKKLLFVPLIIGLVVVAGYFLWEKNKSTFVKHKIADLFLSRSDSLYSIQYDSLFISKDNSDAYFTNIHVIGDTARARASLKDQPYALLDIQIKSLSIKGMHTGDAIKGKEIIADSIIIDNPRIIAYLLRKVRKETKVDAEARNIYKDIFHKLKLIQVSQVDVRNANIYAVNFWNKERQFDIANANILLNNVRIDSAQREDSSRLLFCKRATLHTDHFTTFNRNREELFIKGIDFSSETKNITLSILHLNKFADHGSNGTTFLAASNIRIAGIDNFQVIKKKNLQIDSIYFGSIKMSLPETTASAQNDSYKNNKTQDSVGFRASYGFDIHTIFLPSIELSGGSLKDADVGKFIVKAHHLKADQISDFQSQPMNYLNDIDIRCPKFSSLSRDKIYRNTVEDVEYNSARNQLHIGAIRFIPQLAEGAFAGKFKYQKDRYDASFHNIILTGPKLKSLLQNKISIENLTVASGGINIYRDLSKPLDVVSKVGSYPHQILMHSEIPIDIRRASFNNLNIQYKERNAETGKHGIIRFNNTTIALSNVTNLATSIRANSNCIATLNTTAIKNIPLAVTFKFPLNTTDGHFDVKGDIGSFDMKDLNELSRTLTSLEIDDGHMDDARFEFSGNDHSTSGHLIMKYDHLKVGLLKKNDTGGIQKRKFMSLFANLVIKNENPHKGKLRDYEVQYDRDEHKSFFNLVWRTIFTGMKATVGLPGPKIK